MTNHKLFVLPTQTELNEWARSLRREFASTIAPSFVKEFDVNQAKENVARSIYRDYIDQFPSDEPLLWLAFNPIIEKIRIIGNCANKSSYAYTEDEVNRIFSAIDKELKIAKIRFTNRRKSEFKL